MGFTLLVPICCLFVRPNDVLMCLNKTVTKPKVKSFKNHPVYGDVLYASTKFEVRKTFHSAVRHTGISKLFQHNGMCSIGIFDL